MIEHNPKNHYLDNLESMLVFQQKKGTHQPARLAVARLYELLGHINIEDLSTSNVLVYWKKEALVPEKTRKFYHKDSPTASFFRGIRYLIKAGRSYDAARRQEEATNVLDRTALFLRRATKEHFFDEEVLRAASFELLGDVLSLQQNAVKAREHYEKARAIYKEFYAVDESLEATWQVQEEFEALGAIFEPLEEEVYSDILLEHYSERLKSKEDYIRQSESA